MHRVAPDYLAIHLTYRCPARCSHCCFSSHPNRKGHLSSNDVRRIIDEAARLGSLKFVGFTGGDPFLHTDILIDGVAHTRKNGLKSRVVTSAYWATSPQRASRELQPLAQAGLDEMTLSYDDAHAPYVKADRIKNAFDAARALAIEVAFNVCIEPGSRINRAFLRRFLELGPEDHVRIEETWINTTGRAAEEEKTQKESRKGRPEVQLTPCQHVLRGPTVTPTGAILPCCGTIPFRKGLQIGDTKEDAVDSALRRAYQNPVMQWIAFEGPAAILEQITAETSNPITRNDLDGNCHACDVLFSSTDLMALLAERVRDKSGSLRLQRALYEATGGFAPPQPEE